MFAVPLASMSCSFWLQVHTGEWMPLTLTEKLDSRKWSTGDNASLEMVYVLTGTSDDFACLGSGT